MTKVEELTDQLYSKIERILIIENKNKFKCDDYKLEISKIFNAVLGYCKVKTFNDFRILVFSVSYNDSYFRNIEQEVQIMFSIEENKLKVFETTESYHEESLRRFLHYKLSELDKDQFEKIAFNLL